MLFFFSQMNNLESSIPNSITEKQLTTNSKEKTKNSKTRFLFSFVYFNDTFLCDFYFSINLSGFV